MYELIDLDSGERRRFPTVLECLQAQEYYHPGDVLEGAESWSEILRFAEGYDGGINGLFGAVFRIESVEPERPQRPRATELGRPGDPDSPLVVGELMAHGFDRGGAGRPLKRRHCDATIKSMFAGGAIRLELHDHIDPQDTRMWIDLEGPEADRLALHIQTLRKGEWDTLGSVAQSEAPLREQWELERRMEAVDVGTKKRSEKP